MAYVWRSLREADLGHVAAIAGVAFPDHFEDPAYFAERLALSPTWCFGLDNGTGILQGYLIAYPCPLDSIPPLNAPLGVLPANAHGLFLHDLAVCPDAVGKGQASAAVELVAHRAAEADIRDIALVAVNNTASFWQRMKFVEPAGMPSALRTKLAGYGPDARYMRRRI